MGYEERWADRDQHRIYLRDYPGEEPAIALMHGFPDNLHLYDRLVPLLNPPRRVVTFDFLGWGRSDKPAGYPYTASNQTGDLDVVLGQLGLDRVMLVAHDASGPPAIDWALDNPARVSALVLLNTYLDASSPGRSVGSSLTRATGGKSSRAVRAVPTRAAGVLLPERRPSGDDHLTTEAVPRDVVLRPPGADRLRSRRPLPERRRGEEVPPTLPDLRSVPPPECTALRADRCSPRGCTAYLVDPNDPGPRAIGGADLTTDGRRGPSSSSARAGTCRPAAVISGGTVRSCPSSSVTAAR
jgi:pimeloyl-ACP methyl ester carboxylesterase